MNRKYIVCYIGLDISTFFLLTNSKNFSVISVNLIEDFITNRTFNPINLLFSVVYILRINNRLRILELILLQIWKVLNIFSSSIYYKYKDYLIELSTKRITVIDLTTANAVTFLSNRCDISIVNNWWLLPDQIIYAPKYKTINVHPSRLPQYMGSLPTLWTLKNHDRESAVSYIILNSDIDHGSIINQHIFIVNKDDNAIDIEHKVVEIVRKTLLQDIEDYIIGVLNPQTQGARSKSITAKYYEYMKIRWQEENGLDIVNKIVLYPYLWPLDQCYTFFQRQTIKIKSARLITKISTDYSPGEFFVKNFTLFIITTEGLLSIPLFTGINFFSSIVLLLHRKGIFI